MKTILRSDEFSCPSCVRKIEKRLEATPGVLGARVHFATGRIEVEHDTAAATVEELVEVVRKVGYTSHPSPF